MSAPEVEGIIESPWSGGGSPFAINSKKLGMWLFIVSDSLTFSALLVSYAYVRLANPDWPRPFEIWPAIAKSTAMTLILLSSSLTMVFAVSASRKGETKKAVRMLYWTIFFGLCFVAIHATEWVTLFHEGVTPWSNPWGVPLFGGTFFGLTGLHMLHVTIGAIYLAIISWGFGKGKYNADHVEVSGLYWHFVDLVWMFIFPMVYLMSVSLKG
ncbi:MAG TPA: cytochrome c oxidase subunit 3 [Candidatus Limnocylindrales bacterium]|nr:cytochrome c oxidase subunit 3 [Candidatus Limnocylindrales bacterium]